MSDEECFLAAIRAAPYESLNQGVYADWLDEHERPFEAAVRRSELMGLWKPSGYVQYQIGARYIRETWSRPAIGNRRMLVSSSVVEGLTIDEIEESLGTIIQSVVVSGGGSPHGWLAHLKFVGYKQVGPSAFTLYAVSDGDPDLIRGPCERCGNPSHGDIGTWRDLGHPSAPMAVCRDCYRQIFPNTRL